MSAKKFMYVLLGWMVFSGLSPDHAKGQTTRSFRLPDGIREGDYVKDVIIVKIRADDPAPGQRTVATPVAVLDKIRTITKSKDIRPAFPAPPMIQAHSTAAQNALSHIYKIQVSPGASVVQTINQLLGEEAVVYAEPYYLMQPLGYVPNDPEAKPGSGKQDYLATVKAYEAWEIEKGDSSIIIGILDTGVGLGHEDLTDNLKYQPKDPLNGKDDDQDGYIDNYLGWDMADNDNDPTADKDPHGTTVTGIAAATADNGKGMAGAGFHTSYMPVKVFRSADNTFWKGYEAIAYAADRGCKVINLSWGLAKAYSAFAQDVINYAVLEKDAVVIAAAGNSGKAEDFYPASYDNVVSVAVSDAKDNKLNQTTYNYLVDLTAPGGNNFTTTNDDNYRYSSGSSMSAPLVAGAAALVRAKYPKLSALQVMEKLRLSADNTEAVGDNKNYKEQLGYGRLNMQKALLPLTTPALRMTSFSFRNWLGAYAYGGDTLRIRMNFTNYFASASADAIITLTTSSQYVTLLDSVFRPGAIDSLQTVGNSESPFRLYLHTDLPADEKLTFRLGYADSRYTDYQYFTITSSPGHLVLDNGSMKLTLGSNGDMAYDPNALPGGTGLLFEGVPIAKHMGLVIASGADSVSDNVVQDFANGTRSQDFSALQNIRFYPPEVTGLEARSVFSDDKATHPLGLQIEQTWLADTLETADPFLIAQYRLSRQVTDTLTGLHLGLFADWNLGDGVANRAAWDASHRLGYVYTDNLYAGVALLTAQTSAYHAIDIGSLNGNASETGNIFTDEERYRFLTEKPGKQNAGVKGAGNDVAYMVGGITDSLYQTQTYAFVLVAGADLKAIQQAVAAAQRRYTDYLARPALSETLYTCQDSTVTIAPEGEGFRFYQDPFGSVLLSEGSRFTTGPVAEDTTLYFTRINQGYESSMSRVDVLISAPVAAFSFDTSTNAGLRNDTLFIDDEGIYEIDLKNESLLATTWQWDFGNGYQSTQQHPQARYDKDSTYTITLQVFSAAGCQHTFTRTLTVIKRAPAPALAGQQICFGTQAVLEAYNTDTIKVYKDDSLRQLVYEGDRYTTDFLYKDTVFYVVNAASVYESLPETITVRVTQPLLDITYALDTLDLSTKYSLLLEAIGDLTGVSSVRWYAGDTLIGEGENIQYNFSKQQQKGRPFTIRLNYTLVHENTVCTFDTTRTLTPVAAPKPAFAVDYICQDEQAVISPLEGETFYFYQDASLDTLLYKGKTLRVSQQKGSHTYYVTRMDGLKESEPAAVTVLISRFADFSLSADTLYLSEEDEVTLKAFTLDDSDPRQVSWNWDLGNGQLVTRPMSFVQQFDSAGVYDIRLVARTAAGCVNTIEKTLVVQNVTATETERMNATLIVYPNPSTGRITLKNTNWLYENLTLSLVSLQGKVLFSRPYLYQASPLMIDLLENGDDPFSGGIYLLRIENRYGRFFRKIVLTDDR